MGRYGTILSALVMAAIFTFAIGAHTKASAADSGGQKEGWRSQYDWVGEFHEDRAVAMKNGEWFHVLRDGKPAYDARYEQVGEFSEGRAAVKKNGTWSYISYDGKSDRNGQYYYAGKFLEGRAAVHKNGEGYHIRLLDESPAYEERYDYVGEFSEGRALVRKCAILIFINLDGERVEK